MFEVIKDTGFGEAYNKNLLSYYTYHFLIDINECGYEIPLRVDYGTWWDGDGRHNLDENIKYRIKCNFLNLA